MRAPLPGVLLLTQLFGSKRGGKAEAYGIWDGGTTRTVIGHPAIDLDAPVGTPILAVFPGIVTTPDPQPDPFLGIHAILTDHNGRTALYAHLSAVDVANGTAVGPGHTFGRTGATGNVTGPHLHLAIRNPHPDLDNGFDGYTDWLAGLDHDCIHLVDTSLV